jgi:hypothetical protein
MARLRDAVLFHPHYEAAQVSPIHGALIIWKKRVVLCRPGVIGQWKQTIAVRRSGLRPVFPAQ